MALSRLKTWVAGEVLTAADQNAEFNNILNNALSLVSPWTANMDAGGYRLITLAAGTVGNPAVQPTGDTDTGLYFPAADQFGLAAGGKGYIGTAPGATMTGVLGMTLDQDVAAMEVVNTVTQTTVYSYSVPANTLGTARKLRLTLLGDYLNNSGADRGLTIRGKYGATTFAEIGRSAISTSASRRAVFISFELSALNATNAQVGFGRQQIGTTDGVGGGAVGEGYVPGLSMHVTVAEDSTAAKTLAVTVEHSAAASTISFNAQVAHLEVC